MLQWSIIFLVLSIIAGILVFAGVAGAATGIAKLLFAIFLGLLALTAILGLDSGNRGT